SVYSAMLGEMMGLDAGELKILRQGGILHDLGKIAIPDRILLKGGPLNEEEWSVMRSHPVIGERLLKSMKSMHPVLPLIRHHHERWDGRGYPDGLHGEQIPIGARILALVISYDVLTNDQPYQKRRSREEALEALEADSGQS